MKTTKKFEVKRFAFEEHLPLEVDESTAWDAWFEKVDQDMRLVAAFDTLEEAQECFDKISLSAPKKVDSWYNRFEGKVIEFNEYDEDGEWIAGGDDYAAEIKVKKAKGDK